jgi:hypothetical protein
MNACRGTGRTLRQYCLAGPLPATSRSVSCPSWLVGTPQAWVRTPTPSVIAARSARSTISASCQSGGQPRSGSHPGPAGHRGGLLRRSRGTDRRCSGAAVAELTSGPLGSYTTIRAVTPGGWGRPHKRPDYVVLTAATATPLASGCCAAAESPTPARAVRPAGRPRRARRKCRGTPSGSFCRKRAWSERQFIMHPTGLRRPSGQGHRVCYWVSFRNISRMRPPSSSASACQLPGSPARVNSW